MIKEKALPTDIALPIHEDEDARHKKVRTVHPFAFTATPKPIVYDHIHLNRPDLDNILPSTPGCAIANLNLLDKKGLTSLVDLSSTYRVSL